MPGKVEPPKKRRREEEQADSLPMSQKGKKAKPSASGPTPALRPKSAPPPTSQPELEPSTAEEDLADILAPDAAKPKPEPDPEAKADKKPSSSYGMMEKLTPKERLFEKERVEKAYEKDVPKDCNEFVTQFYNGMTEEQRRRMQVVFEQQGNTIQFDDWQRGCVQAIIDTQLKGDTGVDPVSGTGHNMNHIGPTLLAGNTWGNGYGAILFRDREEYLPAVGSLERFEDLRDALQQENEENNGLYHYGDLSLAEVSVITFYKQLQYLTSTVSTLEFNQATNANLEHMNLEDYNEREQARKEQEAREITPPRLDLGGLADEEGEDEH